MAPFERKNKSKKYLNISKIRLYMIENYDEMLHLQLLCKFLNKIAHSIIVFDTEQE